MADKIVNRRISIFIDQASAEAAQQRLQAQFDKTSKKVRDLQAAGKDAKTELSKLDQIKGKMTELDGVISGKLRPSLNLMKKTVSDLHRELSTMSADAPGYAQKLQHFQEASAEFQRMKQEIGGVKTSLQSLAQSSGWATRFKAVVAGVIGGNLITTGIQKLFQATQRVVSGNVRLSDSLADVRQTTQLTDQEVGKLNKDLKEIDTRTVQEQLLKIAEIGGQFNVPKEQLEAFIEQINKANVVLGSEFSGGAEEITTELSLLRNVFSDIKSDKIDQDLAHIGNALVTLAQDGAATAPVISDFAKRISPLESTAKLTSGAVLGLSATLQELAVNPERGGTAVVRLFAAMTDNVGAFAKVAGVSEKAFKNLLQNNSLEAFTKVLEGFKNGNRNVVEMNKVLGDLEVSGIGAKEVLTKLSDNVDLLKDRTNTATEALTQQDKITEQYNIKNNNLSANVSKLGKVFTNLTTSTGMIEFLNTGVKLLTQLAKTLISVAGFVKDNEVAFGLWTAAIILNNTARLNNLKAFVLEKAAHYANIIAVNAEIVATTALSAAKALLSGNIAKARQEFKLLTAAFGANPLSAILIAAGALLVLFNQLAAKSRELTATQRVEFDLAKRVADATAEQLSKVQQLTSIVTDNKIALDKRKQALQELININPDYLNGLTLENASTAEGKRLIDEYVDSLKKKAEAEALSSLRVDKLKEQQQLQLDIQKAQAQLPGAGGALLFSIPTQLGLGPFAHLDKLKEKLSQVNGDLADIDQRIQKGLEENATTVVNNTKKTITTITDQTVADVKKQKDEADKLLNEIKALAKELGLAYTDQFTKNVITVRKYFQALEDRANKYISDEKVRSKTLIMLKRLEAEELKRIQLQFISNNTSTAGPVAIDPRKATAAAERLATQAQESVDRILRDDVASAQLKVLQSSGKARLNAKLQLLEAEKAAELHNANLTVKEREKIEADYQQKRGELQRQYFTNLASNLLGYLQSAAALYSQYAQNQNANDEAELARDQQKNDKEKQHLQQQLNSKQISRQQYDQKIAALDEQYQKKQAALKLREFRREQNASEIQALINGAVALTRIFAEYPFPFNLAPAAAQAILTGIQIKLIRSQKPPAYGKGGSLNGPKHSSPYKGMPVINPATGQVQAYMEGGEVVVTAPAIDSNQVYTATGTPRQITSAINSRYGGVSWASGATLTPRWLSATPSRINLNGLQRSFEVKRQYAAGGIFPSNNTNDSRSAGSGQPVVIQGGFSPEQFAALMNAFKTKLKAEVSLKDINRQQQRLDDIKNNATLG